MNILAFDTCLAVCSAALLQLQSKAEDGVTMRCEMMTRGHAEALMPMIADIMAEASLPFSQLDRIAVTRGPGTFTGVRVGVSAARGLALAINRPTVGVSTLEAIAASACARDLVSPGTRFAVAIDARREQIYVQCFAASSSGAGPPDIKPLGDPAVCTPDMASDRLPAGITQVIGSGATLLCDASGTHLEIAAHNIQPDAESLARYAATAPLDPAPVKPLYLRPPDAKPQKGFMLPRTD